MNHQGAESVLEKVRRDLDILLPKNANNAVITVNAGGVGVWVATTSCIAMLGIVIVGALWASREFSRVDQQLIELREENKTMQTYLSAIYQIAPSLKPKEEKKK